MRAAKVTVTCTRTLAHVACNFGKTQKVEVQTADKLGVVCCTMSKSERHKGERKKPKTLSETVVAVFPDGKAGKKALEALECAIDKGSSSIQRIPFEQLDFGDLKALEKFYSAPVVVVDVTERRYEACLYYQIGLRESFGMKHNVVTCVDQESSYIAAGTFIPDQISSTANVGVCV